MKAVGAQLITRVGLRGTFLNKILFLKYFLYADGMRRFHGVQACHTDSVPALSPLVVSALPSLGTFVVHHGEGIFCVDPEQGKGSTRALFLLPQCFLLCGLLC